jgi:hypothetical protein
MERIIGRRRPGIRNIVFPRFVAYFGEVKNQTGDYRCADSARQAG